MGRGGDQVKKFPKTINLKWEDVDGDPWLLTLDKHAHLDDGDKVGIYQLVEVKRVRVKMEAEPR